MSFRKRNLPLLSSSPSQAPTSSLQHPIIPGTRPSPLDARPTTSTGTPTVDALLAGHAGLPLGTSLLIEEDGTTDFAGVLVRFFAAEGVLQGQKVFVVLGGAAAAGAGGERWGRDLPGLAAGTLQTQSGKQEDGGGGGGREGIKKEEAGGEMNEKMRIAWRYERLGEFGGGGGGLAAGSRGTKYVSFPVRSSLVNSEKQQKPKIIHDGASFANSAVVFVSEKGLTGGPEICQYRPLRVKLVYQLPRHQYSAILLTLQNG